MVLKMKEKSGGKNTGSVSARIGPAQYRSLVDLKDSIDKDLALTPFVKAAVAFYLDAVKINGIDKDKRPKVGFVKAKDGPSIKTANKKEV